MTKHYLSPARVALILASAVLPLAKVTIQRQREMELHRVLREMRTAIDKYKDYADRGLILLSDVDQKNYPRSLDELVEGIEVGQPPEAQVVKFLGRIPVDPITDTAEWGLRSYQDDWDSRTWGGENVYDVYSLSEAQALDGTYYKDW